MQTRMKTQATEVLKKPKAGLTETSMTTSTIKLELDKNLQEEPPIKVEGLALEEAFQVQGVLQIRMR